MKDIRDIVRVMDSNGNVLCDRKIYGIHRDGKMPKVVIDSVFKENGFDFEISDDCNCYLLLDILAELKYRIPINVDNLMRLIKVVEYYKVEPCVCIVRVIVENLLMEVRSCLSNDGSERALNDKIEERFNEYFPGYSLVKREYALLKGKLRVDFLAKEDATGRDVVIEVKRPKGEKINKQLLRYGEFFDNPILVAVNSTDAEKLENITYMNIS